MTYHFDSTFHLFRRLDGGNFSYSDGAEAETRLLTLVTSADDRSTFSPELAASITDWVSEYHLSKSRHCLLRPLGIQAGNKVLELGCGCGAITRFLGEIGADVVAVEGSLARAHIAAERCRDLANVRIIVDDLLRFETEERFDFIFLIGVLEYAAVFSDYTNPFEHYLRAVAHLLGPDGKLVVAIENKLGLKYFNGCGEDHVGAPFFGIQDLYQSKTVRTFGRRELIAQLCGADLSHVQFYYPFPDYKLPSVILSEAALSDKRFDAIDLLARCHARDYTGHPFRSFDDALAAFTLQSNGLLADLSNSFLVTASAQQVLTNAPVELATSFSVHRAAEFCTQTKFVLNGDGIQVQKEYLTGTPQQPIVLSDGLTIRHRLDDSAYRPGRQLLWKLLKTRARTGDSQGIVEALRPWMGFLLQHARVPAGQITGLGEKPSALALYRLPATFVDCTPFNVLETNSGLFAIDLEWTSDSEVSLGWVVARGVLHSLLAGVPSANPLNSNAEIANALCSEFGLSVSEQELEAWMEREAHFQTAVMGAETTRPTIRMTSGGLRTWLSEITRLSQVVAERDDLLTSVYNTLGARDKQVAEVYQVLASRDEEVASLGHTIRAQEQETVRIREQLQHAQAELGRTHEEIGRTQEELGRTHEELGRTHEEIGRRTEEVGRAHEELGHAQEELGGLLKQLSIVRTQLGAIEASTSWKITKVFRDALSPYPGLRRAIKRISRIVYWTATLQLPQRLKARRRLLKDRDQIAASPLFDAAWYLREYSDVASAGLDPALHYLLFGAAERRNPGPSFDAAWYLEHNADLAAARVNPLQHYLRYGHSEGRQSRAVASAETKETPEEGLESPESASAKSAMSALLVVRLNTLLSGTAILKLPVSDTPDISIILVLHNRAELTLACLASIRECLGASEIGIQVVIFDNGSTDLTSALLARVEGAKIIRNSENLHFLRGVNRAAAEAIGRHILLLNNDAQLLPGSLEAALRTLESATDIGAVGGRIILPDGTLQEAGSIIWNDGTCLGYARGRKPDDREVMFRRDVDFCSGAFLLTRRELFERLGGFDEDFAPAYYEEVDYCVRLWQAGFRVVYDPDVVILHYEFASASSSAEALLLQRTNRRLFCDKHSDWLCGRRAPSQRYLLQARIATQGKRILVIEDRVPHSKLGRGYPRSRAIVQALVDADAKVSFFPMFESDDLWPDVKATMDPSVEVLLGSNSSGLQKFLTERKHYFDAILVCRPHNMREFLAALNPDRSIVSGARIIYDAEAIFATRDILHRQLVGEIVTPEEQRRLISEEIRLTESADVVVSVSEREKQLFLENGVRHVVLLGYPIEPNPTSSDFETRPDILFLGTVFDDESPNADSLRWFAKEVLPHLRSELNLDVRLKVVGLVRAPSIEALDGAELNLIGCVDDLKPHFEKARVVVVPTRFAAGIPLKGQEAASFGVPMVVTDLIATQLGWGVGRDLLTASDGRSFATECARLYRSRELWEAIRCNALERVANDCSPKRFEKAINDLLSEITARSPWEEIDYGSADKDQPVGARPVSMVSRDVLLPELKSFADNLFGSERTKPASNLKYVFRSCDHLDAEKLGIKAIAFYLPQFYPIPENDLWWGKGFTEWANTAKAVPQFLGHYQPHLPGDLGFYDLRIPDVMQQQVELAQQYGIAGFCFHHYWFGGKRLLERPIDHFVRNSSLKIKFCICWANENWSRRWDGSADEVLIAQEHSLESDRAFLDSLLPFFDDPRYIRIDGKPVLLIYRISLLPQPAETITLWREIARRHGFPDIFVVAARTFEIDNLGQYGVDGAVEFPPHQTFAADVTGTKVVINSGFQGIIHDYREVADRFGKREWRDIVTFKTVFPSWDNEARKPGRATIFADSNPESYAGWLEDACSVTASRRKPERLVFINAWNEWAEGAHLEPDREFGHAYLHATSSVLRQYYSDSELDSFIRDNNASFKRRSDVAIVLHCYHEDIVAAIVDQYLKHHASEVDTVATIKPDATVECLHYLRENLGNVLFVQEENRGRDIRPFLRVLSQLKQLGYVTACKVHTKRSPHRQDGGQWRDTLIASLLGGEQAIDIVRDRFRTDASLGLLVPQGSLIDLSVEEINRGNRVWLDRLLRAIHRDDLVGSYQTLFPAGSMYWFRVNAFAGLDNLVLREDAFELEAGQRDGTLAHAIERIVLLYASAAGYSTEEIDVSQIQGNLHVQNIRG